MAKNKATHKGTCQACGRLQKLPKGVLSIHGYTVDWGYFNGVCGGARHQPLEESRVILDQTVTDMRTWADKYEASDRVPAPTVRTYNTQTYKYDVTSCTSFRQWLRLTSSQRSLGHLRDPKWRDVRHAKIRESWDYAQKCCVNKKARDIAQAREHADMLVALADRVHGKELTPV